MGKNINNNAKTFNIINFLESLFKGEKTYKKDGNNKM